jgi:CDP-diacylglycerol--serine O-phosphatidyltransferase
MNDKGIFMLTRISDTITVFSICLGFSSLIFTFEGMLKISASLILLCALLDGVDGVIARLEDRCTREFGVMLDSLSDALAFCVSPAFFSYSILSNFSSGHFLNLILIICAVYVAFGMMRLARFNVRYVEKRKRNGFEGLPTTASGIILSTLLILEFYENSLIYLHPIIMLILSILMIGNSYYPKPRKKEVVIPFSILSISFIISVLLSLHITVITGLLIMVAMGVYVLSPLIPYREWIER